MQCIFIIYLAKLKPDEHWKSHLWFIELSLCYRITMDSCCVHIHVYILGMHNYYHISASIRLSTSITHKNYT